MTTDFETELARGDKWKAVEVLLRGGDGATTSFQSNPHPPLSHFGVAGSELDHQVMEEESLGLEGAVLRSPGGNDLGGSHDPMSVAPPDPFAPSTSTSPPDPRGSPGDRRKARKARKDLSAFLFEVLVQGLASEGGKSSRIPPSLSLGDVLYLVYSLRPEDGDRPSHSSRDGAASVFEALDAHLQRALGEDTASENVGARVGRAHGKQWVAITQANLGFVSEAAPVERHLARRFLERALASAGSDGGVGQPQDSARQSLADCGSFLSRIARSCRDYLGAFASEVEGAFDAPLKSWKLERALMKVNKDLGSEIQAGLRPTLQAARTLASAKLAEIKDLCTSPPINISSGILSAGWELDHELVPCSDAHGDLLAGCAAMAVHEPAKAIFDFVARAWDAVSKTNESESDLACVDRVIVATCFEILSDTLDCLDRLMAARFSHPKSANFKPFAAIANAVSVVGVLAKEMGRASGEWWDPLQPSTMELASAALTLSHSAARVEKKAAQGLSECVRSHALKFYVLPMESAREDWASEKKPEEDLHPTLIGFAGFCHSVLGQASSLGVAPATLGSLGALLALLLCKRLGNLYRDSAPSASRKIRFLCDLAYLTKTAGFICAASKPKDGKTAGRWKECEDALEESHKHASHFIVRKRFVFENPFGEDGSHQQNASTVSGIGDTSWKTVLVCAHAVVKDVATCEDGEIE